MLKQIINEVLNIREAKEIEKVEFKYFYIEEYDSDNSIHDINDLMSRDYINVLLITDTNFEKEELTAADEVKISTEDLEEYLVGTWDDYSSGDYMDFMGNYGLDALIGGYIEDVHKKKWCRKYSDLERLMDAENRIDMTESVIKESTDYSQMSLSGIASIVRRDWRDIYFGAKPYLQAMATLDSIDDKYGMDSGRSIVAYFLSNARGWKGDVAREVKKELNKRLKGR